ncbi:MAG: M20/M25/M40 family metallo-hydrolase [Anaerolineae bacterium]|nr:M20/M25/M40 family metallo-hydrolase [Anaerolineae bacterium]
MSHIAHFDGRLAYDHLRHLAVEIGGRLGGSPAEKRAADYIESHFRGLGLEARQQSFPVRTYGAGQARLEITDPPLGEIPCEIFYLSQDTPPEGVTGELLFAGSADLEDIGPEWRDRIVVVLGLVRGEAHERAMRLGPLGFIGIMNQLGTPPIRIEQLPEVRARAGAVPTVLISHADGLRLVQAGARRARITVRSQEADATSQNVIGELRGTVYPDEIVVVCGHYDSSLEIQGASDNAGGTAAVMELARVFAARGSWRTLRFIAFGSEELGLRGSVHYVKELKAADKAARKAEGFVPGRDLTELERHVLCVNIDVQGVLLGTNGAWNLGPADLAAAVRLLAREQGPAFEVKDEVYSSDGTPLSEAGVPSISFARFGATSEYLHTTGDTVEYLGPQPLELQGRFIETFLQRYVASARALPFERKIPEEMQKKIREYFEKRLRIDYFKDEEKK